MRTHYQNLKVAEDAPAEVIKAAWRALTQLHHPDRNSSADALRVTQIINDAYEVLSDPSRRQTYDARLAAMRKPPAPIVEPSNPVTNVRRPQMPKARPPRPPQAPRKHTSSDARPLSEVILIWVLTAVLALVVLALLF